MSWTCTVYYDKKICYLTFANCGITQDYLVAWGNSDIWHIIWRLWERPSCHWKPLLLFVDGGRLTGYLCGFSIRRPAHVSSSNENKWRTSVSEILTELKCDIMSKNMTWQSLYNIRQCDYLDIYTKCMFPCKILLLYILRTFLTSFIYVMIFKIAEGPIKY